VTLVAFLQFVDAGHDHDFSRHQARSDFRVIAFSGADGDERTVTVESGFTT